jgi:hypothetical protein
MRDGAAQRLQQARSWGSAWSSTAASVDVPHGAGDAWAPAFEAPLPEEGELWPRRPRRGASPEIEAHTESRGAQVDVVDAMGVAAPDGPWLLSAVSAAPASQMRFAGSELGRLLLSRKLPGLPNAVREDPHAIAVVLLGSYLEHATRLPSPTKVARVLGRFNMLVRSNQRPEPHD